MVSSVGWRQLEDVRFSQQEEPRDARDSAHKVFFDTIKKRSVFIKISQCGDKIKTDSFILRYLKSDTIEKERFGYTASKKVGNAVKRNRAKRRLRELVRHFAKDFREDYRYVFIAFPSTPVVDFQKLKSDFEYALSKSNERISKHDYKRYTDISD